MHETNCKPRNALVLIRVPKREEVNEMGLYVPIMPGQQFRRCEIVEVGPGTPEIGGTDVQDLQAGMFCMVKIGIKAPPRGREIAAGQMQLSCVPMSADAVGEEGLYLVNQADILVIYPETPESSLALSGDNS